MALLTQALTNFALFVLLPTPRGLNNTLPTPRQRHPLVSGHHVALLSLLLLSGTAFLAFFSVFRETRDNMFQQLKINV
jgi:hypothetical protein